MPWLSKPGSGSPAYNTLILAFVLAACGFHRSGAWPGFLAKFEIVFHAEHPKE